MLLVIADASADIAMLLTRELLSSGSESSELKRSCPSIESIVSMSYDVSCEFCSVVPVAAPVPTGSFLLSNGLRGPSLSSALPAPVKPVLVLAGEVALFPEGDEGDVVIVRPSEMPTLNTLGILAPVSPNVLATETESVMLLANVRYAPSVLAGTSCRCVEEGSAKAGSTTTNSAAAARAKSAITSILSAPERDLGNSIKCPTKALSDTL
jgi:hypothetical protein